MRSRSTTILTVRHKGEVAIGGDGQVSLGDTIVKADAQKIRSLLDGKVKVGFAGTSADAFALLERLESKLKDFPGNVPRAATELAKEWRTDRALRRLEALMAVVDGENTLLITGNGDVIQPTDGILGIGSGGAAMGQVDQHLQPLLDHIVGLVSVDVADEADAACVMLEARVVEPLRLGHMRVRHVRSSSCTDPEPPRRGDGICSRRELRRAPGFGLGRTVARRLPDFRT